MKLAALDDEISAESGHGNDWSAQWAGFVAAPVTDEATFFGQCNKRLIADIAGKQPIDIRDNEVRVSGSLGMAKGKKYPICVKYFREGS